MGVPFVIPDPGAIVELAPMREALATVTNIGAANATASVGILPAASIVLGGIEVERALLNNEHWDNFWLGIGGRLTDVWNSASNLLFGHHATVSVDTVRSMTNYALHVSLRTTRQLVTGLAAQTSVIQSRLYKGVVAVANAVGNLSTWTTAQLNHLRALEVADVTAARHYAEALSHNAAAGLAGQLDARVNALRAELIRDILNPLHVQVTNLVHTVEDVRVTANTSKWIADHKLLPGLAAATLLAGEAAKLARVAKQWEDDCGEPMCQTVGPKTDWGKLFKRFDAAAILALLTALAATDPSEIEHAAEEFGRTFGPLLSTWASGWLGLSGGDVSHIPGEVAHGVGSILKDVL